MALQPLSSSRYRISQPIVTDDGIETYGTMTFYDFLKPEIVKNNYIKFIVDGTTAGRPDKISNQVYGSPIYYWIVIMYNRPKSPFNWPNVGDVIYLPSKSIIIPSL